MVMVVLEMFCTSIRMTAMMTMTVTALGAGVEEKKDSNADAGFDELPQLSPPSPSFHTSLMATLKPKLFTLT